jgi:catechol 2,3-dioxygenase-like lactoylglutathione lyase family enzyme
VKKSVSKKASVRPQPLIAVGDVRASSRWYQRLLGLTALPEHEHRDTYEDHPNLVNADAASRGHGVVLWFEVDDFEAAVKRARSLHAEVIEEPYVNPNAGHREMWLRDRDGYVVVTASPGRE